MKNFLILFTLIFTFILTNPLLSADEATTKPAEKGVVFGIGTNTSPISLYFPIQTSKHFRIEPMIGVSLNDVYHISDNSNSTNNTIMASISLGIGFLYTIEPFKSSKIYYGPRLIYSNNYYNNNQKVFYNSNEIDKHSFVVGACFGAEYYLVKQFSLGLEVQLNYMFFINNSSSAQASYPFNSINPSYKEHSLYNSNLIFFRYYFDY